MQEAFSLTSEAVRGRSAASAVAEHVERAMRRADEIRPARDALAAADTKKRLGNDAFRAGDYLKAYSEYGEAHEALNVASEESTTSWEAERARLTLLANSAQCALKAGKSIRRRDLLPRRAYAQRVHRRRHDVQEGARSTRPRARRPRRDGPRPRRRRRGAHPRVARG